MIIATWNVNGIRARAERLREWLAERKPDLVCLQELKIAEADFPHLELRAAGYHAVVAGQPSWNGVAVLAREPPSAIVRELEGASDRGARFLVARVSGFEIASVYVPNGKTLEHPEYKGKLDWLERLSSHLERREDKDAPLVVAGDFNVCFTDIDSYLGAAGRGTIFHTVEERALTSRLTGSGLVDLFRAKYTALPGFSWWDYRAGNFHKNLGMRLDVLFATEAVARRVQEVYVDREYRKKSKTSGALPSDHAPVIAVLEGT
jgi:exodeoxyribonuclease-3